MKWTVWCQRDSPNRGREREGGKKEREGVKEKKKEDVADSKRWLEGSGALCLIIDPAVSWLRQKCYWGFHIAGYLQDKHGYVPLTFLLLLPCAYLCMRQFVFFLRESTVRENLYEIHWIPRTRTLLWCVRLRVWWLTSISPACVLKRAVQKVKELLSCVV